MAGTGKLARQFPALTELNFAPAARPAKGIPAPVVYAERQRGRKNCLAIGPRKPDDGAGAPGAAVTAGDLGSEVARNDDTSPGVYDSRIVEEELEAGTYTIEATTFRSGRTGDFTLTLRLGVSHSVRPRPR